MKKAVSSKKADKLSSAKTIGSAHVPIKIGHIRSTDPQPKLHNVEFFDTNYGIAIDDDNNLYKIQAEPCAATGIFPDRFCSVYPITIRDALEWLTMMHNVDGVGSSPDYD